MTDEHAPQHSEGDPAEPADYSDCRIHREDGEPYAKIADHRPPCEFPGEWRH